MAPEPRRPRLPARPGPCSPTTRRAVRGAGVRGGPRRRRLRPTARRRRSPWRPRWARRCRSRGRAPTAFLWSALATLGAADLTVARVWSRTSTPSRSSTRRVSTSRPGPGACTPPRARASRCGPSAGTASPPRPQALVLPGRVLDRALITAWVGEERRLFAVDLHPPGGHAVSRDLGCPRSRRPSTRTGRPRRRAGACGGEPAGTSSGPASPGAASASPRSGTAGRRRRAPHAAATGAGSRPDRPMHLGAVDAALHAAGCALATRRPPSTPAASPARRGRAALRVRQVVAARGRGGAAPRGPRARTRAARHRRGPRARGSPTSSSTCASGTPSATRRPSAACCSTPRSPLW